MLKVPDNRMGIMKENLVILFCIFEKNYLILGANNINYKIRNTMPVSRFGVSLEKEMLEALDNYAKENQFTNRSQAIRQLVSKNLVEKK